MSGRAYWFVGSGVAAGALLLGCAGKIGGAQDHQPSAGGSGSGGGTGLRPPNGGGIDAQAPASNPGVIGDAASAASGQADAGLSPEEPPEEKPPEEKPPEEKPPEEKPPQDPPPTGSGPTSACTSSPNAKGLSQHSTPKGTYAAYVPSSYTGATPVPLVVGLHGTGDSGSNFIQYLWKSAADARGFVVIGPQGTYYGAGGVGPAWSNVDAQNVLAAIDDIEACYNINQRKRIVHGFSAGGGMSYFVGFKYAARFAGVAVSQNGFMTGEYLNSGSLLPAAWKIPVSHFQGTQDPGMPLQLIEESNKKLIAAGHPFNWHPFPGGHTTTLSQALTMYDELVVSNSPEG